MENTRVSTSSLRTEPSGASSPLWPLRRRGDLSPSVRPSSLAADADREKRDWMEALREAIAETLSDYEVAEKIWSNRSNRACADCRAVNPDWASINLCVVICKNCAGVSAIAAC